MKSRLREQSFVSKQKTLERLEAIQKTAMTKAGMTDTPHGHPDAFLRHIAQLHPASPEIEARFEEWQSQYPISRHQNKTSFLRVCDVFHGLNQIVQGMQKEAILDKEIPVFGTLPQLDFAACVTCQEKDIDELILVSEGLLAFSRMIANVRQHVDASEPWEHVRNGGEPLRKNVRMPVRRPNASFACCDSKEKYLFRASYILSTVKSVASCQGFFNRSKSGSLYRLYFS
jgi:hypothetical protein